MTVLAWDGHKLVTDSRVFIQHTWKDKEEFDTAEMAHLGTILKQDWWHLSNTYSEQRDGVPKIFVPSPKKPLTYRGERVQAIGVTGETGWVDEFQKLPRGSELMDPKCFVNQYNTQSHFLIITKDNVFDHEVEKSDDKHLGIMFAVCGHRDRFLSMGSASAPTLNGTNPPGLDSETYVDFACMMHSISGGPRWVWDSHTNELTLKPEPPFKETLDKLRRFYKEQTLHVGIAGAINDAINDSALAMRAAKHLVATSRKK